MGLRRSKGLCPEVELLKEKTEKAEEKKLEGSHLADSSKVRNAEIHIFI